MIDRRADYLDLPGFDRIAFMVGDPRWAEVFATYKPLHEDDRFSYYKHRDAALRDSVGVGVGRD